MRRKKSCDVLVIPSSSSSSSSDEHKSGRRRRTRASSSSSYDKKTKSSELEQPSSSRSSNEQKTGGLFTPELCEELQQLLPQRVKRKRRHEPDITLNDREVLWVDKYKPVALSELAVHHKKVHEVRSWLEDRITQKVRQDNVLLIVGPAGTGKSATVHIIASDLGAEVYEWRTPTPTLWHEFKHNVNPDVRYTSKLDDFVAFVEGVRKYPLLTSTSGEQSKKPVILLIDDLPLAIRRDAFQKMSQSLLWLAQSTQYPTIILITEYGKIDSLETRGYGEDLVAFLQKVGIRKISFNSVTVNAMKKVLGRICRGEMLDLSPEWIDHLARLSGGDIRNAIMSLQYCCLRVDLLHSPPLPHLGASLNDDLKEFSEPDIKTCDMDNDAASKSMISTLMGKDETLSLFHALGKFLHNKRDNSVTMCKAHMNFDMLPCLQRGVLKLDAPEKVLSQAHAEASKVVDYLHENVLDFLSGEAIDDAAVVASYLSEADLLHALSLSSSVVTSTIAGGLDLQSAAASVAVRGVQFGNSVPSHTGWHSIRVPRLWHVERSLRQFKNDVLLRLSEDCSSFHIHNLPAVATDLKPNLSWLESRMATSGSDVKSVTDVVDTVNFLDCSSEDRMSCDGDGDECKNVNEMSEDDDIEEW